MEGLERFNARCYALICSDKGRLLVLKERWRGVDLQKLPGGGLELGEGMLECLDREISEEFESSQSLTWAHFHCPTHCFSSQFRPEEQLLLNYFLAEEQVHEGHWSIIPDDPNILELVWLDIEPSNVHWFTLESDRDAFMKLVALKA